MEEKLRRLMKHEGINSTRLAEMLGIQASGISHIMSGRNQPSGAFLMKLLHCFPEISPDWLLLDKGPMYRGEVKNKSGASGAAVYPPAASAPEAAGLFSGGQALREAGVAVSLMGRGADSANQTGGVEAFAPDNDDIIPSGGGSVRVATGGSAPGRVTAAASGHPLSHATAAPSGNFARSASIERIVVFYKDKTFSEYQPE